MTTIEGMDYQPHSPERLRPVPRITVITDRVLENLEAIIDYGNLYPDQIELGGVLAPGGDIDFEIHRLMERISGMQSSPEDRRFYEETGIEHTGIAMPRDDEGNWSFMSGYIVPGTMVPIRDPLGVMIDYIHAPYDLETMKKGPIQRMLYCADLGDKVDSTNPSIVFLDNFKIILSPNFVRRFQGRLVNVHPSRLPQNKGQHTEIMADSGVNPEASGYTFHFVDVGLDQGATIFQQQVLLDPPNPEVEAKLSTEGKDVYKRWREERIRYKTIRAQSLYTPRILALVADTSIPRRIISDQEAFRIERREEFYGSPEHEAVLREDYEKWPAARKRIISYEFWRERYRQPYQRVLFQVGGRWQTAEQILGAPLIADVDSSGPRTKYHFRLPCPTGPKASELFRRIQEASRGLGKVGQYKEGRFFNYSGDNIPHGHVTTTIEADVMLALFEELGIREYTFVEEDTDDEEDNDGQYAVEIQGVRVGPKRKPNMFLDPYGPISPLEN